jgi:gamma-glutamyltranspeptidase/glutathione hydrolase
MRFDKRGVPATKARFGEGRRFRQSTAVALALLLAGCGWFGGKEEASPGVATEFQGGVAADEPRAVLVARDILAQGGSAADAAVALAFTMTATLPSRVSLGGGGACLARAGRPREPNVLTIGPINRPAAIPTDAVTFMPDPAPGGQIGMPGLVRGLAMIQARYGRLRWEQLVAPGESIARFGAPMSRALARDLAEAGITMSGPDGKPAGEGDKIFFPELSVTLAAVRARGASDLYTGELAQRYVQGLGGAMDAGALRAVSPALTQVKGTELGNNIAFFTQGSGGEAAAALLKAAEGDRRLRRSDPAERSAALAAAAAKALPARPAGDEDPGTTGFVVVDQRGGAVACSLTLGRLFGARRTAAGTGIVPAAPVPAGSAAALSTAASLVTNENVVQLIGGAGAGGDVAAPEGLVEVLVHAVIGERPIQEAATLYHSRAAAKEPLRPPSAGAVQPSLIQASSPALVNAVVCSGGLPNGPDTCSAQADPRGAGLGQLVTALRSAR